MQGSQIDPRSTVEDLTFTGLHRSVALSQRALIDFQREHDDFLKRAAMAEAGPGHTVLDIDVMPKPQNVEAESLRARLAVENDQLRVERALLLSQLGARDAEIRDLRARLSSQIDEDEFEALPLRKLTGTVRAHAKLGTVRRGAPFIHPDLLTEENE